MRKAVASAEGKPLVYSEGVVGPDGPVGVGLGGDSGNDNGGGDG